MSDDRPGIIYLTPVVPASQGNGLAMRAGLFLAGMSRGHAVTVVVVPVFGTPSPDRSFVDALARSCLTLELAAPADEISWPTELLSTPGGRDRAHQLYPLPTICRQPSPAASRQLRNLVDDACLVHVMRTYLAPCLDFLFDQRRRPPITLDLDELDSRVYRQLGCEQEIERFERLERYYIPRADHLYTASEVEARSVRERCGARQVTTVANAVAPPLQSESVEPEYDLLFVGNLSYSPNVDAVRWLCGEIRGLLEGSTIAIVGSRPGAEVLALAKLPGVTVAADVPDVAPWYARSRVAVAPLRSGGGTRIKILEALAHRRPVVSTPQGATGLATGEENGVLVGGCAADFAAACRRLLLDASAAARIAAAGGRQLSTTEQIAVEIDVLTRAALARRTEDPADGSRGAS